MSKLKQRASMVEIVGRNVGIMLTARGLKPRDVAERLNITESAVRSWLRGERDMGINRLAMVAKILNTTPTMLLTEPEQLAESCIRLL